MNRARRHLRWAAPASVLVLTWAAATWLVRDDGRGPQAPVPAFTDWQFNPFARGEPLAAVQHNADTARTAEAAHAKVQQVLEQGSLRGTEPDGDWGRWVGGQLQPSRSLRQRFDYLLTLLGEASPGEMRHWIEQEVGAQLNAAAARQVLALWDRYLALQQQPFRQQADPADPASWQAALAERVNARQHHLGRDWAQAFYANEEQAFAQFTQEQAARRNGAAVADGASVLVAAPNASPQQAEQLHARRVQQLGADAAERLRAEDAAWADWERRLAAARAQVQSIAAAPELSAPQRQQAQSAYLTQTFSGSELMRARALLAVDP